MLEIVAISAFLLLAFIAFLIHNAWLRARDQQVFLTALACLRDSLQKQLQECIKSSQLPNGPSIDLDDEEDEDSNEFQID